MRVKIADGALSANLMAEVTEAKLLLPEEKGKPTVSLPIWLYALFCFIFAVEGADGALLPACEFAMQRDLGLPLTTISAMCLAQAVAIALSAPVWGVLADRQVIARRTLLCFGAVMQGLITIALAMPVVTDSDRLMIALRAGNGAMLGSLKPIVIGIVAGATPELKRGKVYSVLQTFSSLGSLAAVQIATPLSVHSLQIGPIHGLCGWRVAFVAVGAFAVLTGGLLFAVMDEEKTTSDMKQDMTSAREQLKEETAHFIGYMRMPSFVCLVLQGMLGAVPWQAFNYNTLYFQMLGLSSASAALLNTIFVVGCMAGTMLGGVIGDAFAKRCPSSGRPFTANMSVASGIPLVFLIFGVPTPTGWTPFWWYVLLLLTMGITASWTCTGVNWPILAELVDASRSSSILAWESALESSFSAVAGNAAVGFLAQNIFGYDMHAAQELVSSGGGNEADARALGKAILLTAIPPWVICSLCYVALHWAYRFDRRRLHRERPSRSNSSSSSSSSSSTTETGTEADCW